MFPFLSLYVTAVSSGLKGGFFLLSFSSTKIVTILLGHLHLSSRFNFHNVFHTCTNSPFLKSASRTRYWPM